jgi:predicted Zn finger-like uncharacterized protein
MATGLATRCSNCHTVFRVVPDQLRVSEGWVRCGKCSEVFNALEGLIDLETGSPHRNLGSGLAPPSDRELDIAHPAAKPGSGKVVPEPQRPSYKSSRPADQDIVAELDDRVSRFAEQYDTQADTQADTEAPDSTQHSSSKHAPSFVRRAERAAHWRSPRMRALLLLALLLGSLGLAAQVAHEYRDMVAARWPATRPVLEQACAALACSVGPARSIESLAVESSGLVRVERSALYRLQVALRNRSGIELAVPALDITLTDTQGRLVSRKVLRPAELGVTVATIAAGKELQVAATLQTLGDAANAAPIAGYTIDLFYP